MNISLPDELKAYVDQRTAAGAYQSSSEFIRELIRRDQDVERFRALVREGVASPIEGEADDEFFAAMRKLAES